MTDTSMFFAALYQQLADSLGASAAERDTSILQLAWPGYALAPSDFRRPDAPDGPYDASVARETTAQLANIAPAFSRARFENSGFEIDDLYEILIGSAIPAGAVLRTLRRYPLYKLFADARYDFAQAKRGSALDPGNTYYPCTAVPTRWYDETSAEGWRVLNFRSREAQTSALANSEFARAGMLEAADTGVWRMMPAEGAWAAPAAAQAAPTSQPDAPASDPDAALFQPPEPPENRMTTDRVDVSRVDPTQLDWGANDLRERMAWQAQLMPQIPSMPASAGTRDFSVSMKLCRVNLTRPWLKFALLSTPTWWMFDTAAGAYSNGAADANTGLFPLLTTSFLAVRDLRLSAAWSAEDRGRAAQALSFGCFDLRGAVMNGATLEQPGLQVIGWTSRVTPKLPPLAASNKRR